MLSENDNKGSSNAVFWSGLVILGCFLGSWNALGAPISKQGTFLSYICKSGPKKSCSALVYGERGALSSITTDCGANGIDGDLEVWQYISGLYSRAAEGSFLKIVTLKSGDLANANNPTEGKTYQGVVSHWDRRGTYDMEVKISVGKSVREKTALGSQNLLPITTTIGNSDGKGGTATVQVNYIPAMKIKVSEKIGGVFPERGWDCSLASLKLNQLIGPPKTVKFELPAAGAVLKYQCEGKVKTREIKVLSNSSGKVKYTVTRDGTSSSDVSGDGWHLYAGLAREVVTQGKKDFFMDIKGDDAGQLGQANLKLGAYHSRVVSSGLSEGDYTLRLAIHPQRSYDSKEFGKVDVIPVNGYRSGGRQEIMRTQYLYSEKLKAPIWYRVQERHDANRNQECRLVSHTGYSAKK